MMYGSDDKAAAFIAIMFFIGLTFGVWKLIELVWWLVTHVNVSW